MIQVHEGNLSSWIISSCIASSKKNVDIHAVGCKHVVFDTSRTTSVAPTKTKIRAVNAIRARRLRRCVCGSPHSSFPPCSHHMEHARPWNMGRILFSQVMARCSTLDQKEQSEGLRNAAAPYRQGSVPSVTRLQSTDGATPKHCYDCGENSWLHP